MTRLFNHLAVGLCCLATVFFAIGADKDKLANVALSVVDLDRFPVADMPVSIYADGAHVADAQTNELGVTRITDLKPGRYAFKATGNDGEQIQRNCTLNSGENPVELSFEKEVLKIQATDRYGDPTACKVWRYFPLEPSIRDETIVNETGRAKITRKNCEYPCLVVAEDHGIVQSHWIEKKSNDLVLRFDNAEQFSVWVKIGEDYRKKATGKIQVWLTRRGTVLAEGMREISALEMDPKTGDNPDVQYIMDAKEGLHEVVIIMEKDDKTYETQWLGSFQVSKKENNVLNISANKVEFEGTLEKVRHRISFSRALNGTTTSESR